MWGIPALSRVMVTFMAGFAGWVVDEDPDEQPASTIAASPRAPRARSQVTGMARAYPRRVRTAFASAVLGIRFCVPSARRPAWTRARPGVTCGLRVLRDRGRGHGAATTGYLRSCGTL